MGSAHFQDIMQTGDGETLNVVRVFLAARAIVAIENPADVFIISSRPQG